MAKPSDSQIASIPTFWLLSFSAFLTLATTSQFDCSNQQCGALTNVSFPFSLDDRCAAFSPRFRLQCYNSQGNETVLLSTSYGVFPVLHIFNDSLIIDVVEAKSIIEPDYCNVSNEFLGFASTDPFVLSHENKFGNFNCNSIGVLLTGNITDWTETLPDYGVVGCAANCQENGGNEGCGNNTVPCCVASVPNDTRTYSYSSQSFGNASCGPGFAIPFHPDFTDYDTQFGLKVLWAFPSPVNATDVIEASADYTCSENSHIVLVSQVPGYLCQCQNGFKGDGYSKGSSCTDINECMDAGLNQCIHRSSCRNSNGSYACQCHSKFLSGDGNRAGSGCRISPTLIKGLCISGGFLGVIVAVSFIICSFVLLRKRRRRRFFFQNGGLELQEYMSRRGRGAARFFSEEELQSATQNFSEQCKLGVGGYGAVFQGTLDDGKIVAVKKATRPQEDNHQFLNEVSILMQINHRHIVRLLGCCLETANPLLVYEFVSNGTLLEHLHAEQESKASVSSNDHVPALGWRKRLQIASQTAEALAYLHAAAAPPIVHRDVKSSNILLDDNLEAKVADFGVSRLVPDGEEHVSTAVQGTIGYLDPEYFQTLQLTDRSDVYSLGVVLIELITGMKPVDNHSREPKFANLTLLFIHRMREGRLEELMDKRLAAEEEAEKDRRRREEMHASIVEVARLARRCLALQGAQRPSMREVAEELRIIEKELAVSLKVAAEGGEEKELLLWSGKEYDSFNEASAVVASNAQFYVQSSSSLPPATTDSVDSLLLGLATPR